MDKSDQKTKTPKWARKSDSSNSELGSLLEFSYLNYHKQTDWYLRHKDTGNKNLAAIFAAEFALTGIHYSNEVLPHFLIIISLYFLAVLAPVLAFSSYKSCRKSYMASLESALQITKTIWAMGLTTDVLVDRNAIGKSDCPAQKDDSLYVPRFLNDALEAETTEKFKEKNFGNIDNTYFWGNVTLFFFALTGTLLGALTATFIIIGKG